jgi:LysR family transcriptional regulator, glycine cleavage system transcriptional activator
VGRTPLVDDALKSGLLVEPFGVRVRSEAAYFVSSPKERSQLRTVVRFRDWMLSLSA